MTTTETSGTNRLSTARNYRRALFGVLVAAVLLNVALRYLGYGVAAEAVYLLGAVAALAVWLASPVALFDERDVAIEQRASQLALGVSAVVLVLGASGARLLHAADVFTAPTIVWGVLYGYVAVFATFAVAFLWVRSRR